MEAAYAGSGSRSMRWVSSAAGISLTLGIALQAGCGAGGEPVASPGETSVDTIPLDGRGGGVIAYARELVPGEGIHEIHVINADGTGDRRLIEASIGLNHQDWSPDGLHLAAVGYVNEDTWAIYTFGADGTGLTRLTHEPGVWDADPAWSPDGSLIAFSRIHPREADRSDLWIMNSDGSGERRVGVEGFAARWSPNGRRLLYATSFRGSSDLATCALDGTDVQLLLSTPALETNPSWSPDGSQVLFISDEDGDREVYVMEAGGTGKRRLTDNLAPEFVPRWSPNGFRVAFDSGLSGINHWQVYVANADGSGLRRVTSTPNRMSAVNPAWRPSFGGGE